MIGHKILTVCSRGNSRSVALAFLLKDANAKDALACGIDVVSPATFRMLGNWADTIIVVDKTLEEKIPTEFKEKLVVWDVGGDRYFLGYHPDIIAQYGKFLKDNGLPGDGRFY